MVWRPTRGQVLAVVFGFALVGFGATKLTTCSVSNSPVVASNQVTIRSVPVTATPTVAVDAGCITCVARATEEARNGPPNENGPIR